VRLIILILLPFLAIFLQSTIFATLSIRETIPDIVLIFVCFFALLNGPERGMKYGFLCGLLEDIYLGRVIGINALSKAVVAYIVGKLQGIVFKENILVGVLVTILATLINALLILLITLINMKAFGFDHFILTSIVTQIIYNSVVSIPIYFWYYNSAYHGWLKDQGVHK
jgi:rod shape-determining protein MreD